MCGLVTDIVVFTLASWVAYWTFEGSSPVSKAYLPSLSGPGARRFSPAALHISSPRSEESKDWPQLGVWWHMWATVTRVPNIPASHWSVSHNSGFLLAQIREIWSPDISHRLHVTRKVKCPHWPLLLVWSQWGLHWILLALYFRTDTLTRGW